MSRTAAAFRRTTGAAADELVALVEKPDGSMQIVDYVEFLKRTGQAVP